jgi:DnaJ family protein C protein 17
MILMDVPARAAYDRIQKAKREAELRNKQLDSKRQKLKAELEAREKNAKSSDYSSKSPEEIFKMEFERIMKENKKIVEEENEAIRQQIWKDRAAAQQSSSNSTWDSSQHRIKIKWKAEKNDPTNGGYDKENLTRFMYKYGDIIALLVSAKKNGSAIVEFQKQDAAEMAVEYERGIISNPLKLEWVGAAPKSKKSGATVTDKDYESVVLMKLRQAEERKRLIDQMMRDDEGDD